MKRSEAEKLINNPNIRAFLAMIGEAEGADYRTLVHNGTKNAAIKDLSRHPNKLQGKGRIASTAAGRYQFLYRTWRRFEQSLGLTDFSPKSQDLAAIAQLAEVGAIQPILQGDIKTAIHKARKIWASFPGAGYGQGERKLSKMLQWYQAAKGQVSDAVGNVTETIGNNSNLVTLILGIFGLGLLIFLLI